MDTVLENEVTKTVVDHLANSMSEETLKLAGAFGLGAVCGIAAYRKIWVPAWARWLELKNRSKAKNMVDETPDEYDEDGELYD